MHFVSLRRRNDEVNRRFNEVNLEIKAFYLEGFTLFVMT